MFKVAVMGCGVFGSTIGLKLLSQGCEVTVFDRAPEPLSGASYNNQNRLHLGFHYPRDRATAVQCIEGFFRFKTEFPECIRAPFSNGYFIANTDSKTTPEDFLKYCDDLKLSYKQIDPATFLPEVKNVALGISTDELVYDCLTLRQVIWKRLKASHAELRLNTEVVAARHIGERIELQCADGANDTYDIVVNATYAGQSRIAGSLGASLVERQYEYTVVPIIEAPFETAGLTIMDGRFVTSMPFGFSNNSLLYHVEHAVVATSIGLHMPESWVDRSASPFAKLDAKALYDRTIKASEFFIPSLADAKLLGFLHGPRMVLARRDDSDTRPSIIDQPFPNYFGVFSGKIDHCLGVADEIAARIAAMGQRN